MLFSHINNIKKKEVVREAESYTETERKNKTK